MELMLFNYSLLLYAFLCSAGLVALSIKPALRLGWVDQPNLRKQHRRPVPLTGGIAMCAAFCLTIMLLPEKPHGYSGLLIGMILLTLIGFYDDLRSTRPALRFLFQSSAVLLMVFEGGVALHSLGDLFGLGLVILGGAAIFSTVFSVVGVINAFNMIDGLDGLAGGIALIATGWLIILSLTAPTPDFQAMQAPLILGMVILGFLCFNLRHPWRTQACVFMGDAGSTMIGFALGWFMVRFSQNHADHQSIMTPITAVWILALPLLDTVTVMIRRTRAGQSPFAADRQHLHHLLLKHGLPDGQVTLILLMSAVATGAIGVIACRLNIPEYFQFYAFIATFLLYYRITSRWWRRFHSANAQ